MTEEELEAAGLKYHSPRVVALSSGRFAITGMFSNKHGLPVLDYVSAEGLAEAVRLFQAKALEEAEEEREERAPVTEGQRATGSQLLLSLGLVKPMVVDRRI